jgi:hypothetical protein
MLTPILWMLLLQQDPTRTLDYLRMTNPQKFHEMSEPQARVAQLQRHLFEQRFQKLVDAVQRFSDQYNKGRGYVWPLKEAEALRKAYRNLERSMPETALPAIHSETEATVEEGLR